jgi:hypothetical protein
MIGNGRNKKANGKIRSPYVFQGAAGILPADLTLPGIGAMPQSFCIFRIADRIIIQFDLPAGCRKHFVARPPSASGYTHGWIGGRG